MLVFLNPDTVAAPGPIEQLARTLESPDVGIAMARLRLLDEPEKLNSSGVEVHVSGIGWAGGFGEPADSLAELRDVPAPSGTAMAVRAQTFRELGGFAEELFMYLEDLELGWRARLAGYRVVVDPAADVLHEYEYGRNPRKSYFLERNRLVFVLSAYSPRQLVLLGAAARGDRARDDRDRDQGEVAARQGGRVGLAAGERPDGLESKAADAGAAPCPRPRARPLPDGDLLAGR